MEQEQNRAPETPPAGAPAELPFGEPLLICPGLYRVRVPLPHNPLQALNSYIVLGDETTTIIDVGFNHPACEKALDKALESLGRTWDTVEIVLTHSHPDHTGNLDRIYRDGMRVYANLHSFKEVENLMQMQANVFGPLLRKAATPQQSGLVFRKGKHRLHISAELLPLTCKPDLIYLHEGDVLRAGSFSFEVIETPGHDPWHICLYEPDRKLMIIGDHVLERITPSVSSWFPAYNALEEFLESLGKMYSYDVDLVLPAHGTPYTGLRERVMFLIAHHGERLQELYDLAAAARPTGGCALKRAGFPMSCRTRLCRRAFPRRAITCFRPRICARWIAWTTSWPPSTTTSYRYRRMPSGATRIGTNGRSTRSSSRWARRWPTSCTSCAKARSSKPSAATSTVSSCRSAAAALEGSITCASI